MQWWHWPNVLGLDAALVAVAWQWLLLNALSVPVTAPVSLALFLTVWTIYLVDRWLDARPYPEQELTSHRHRFAKRHAPILRALAMATLTALACLILFLPLPVLLAGSAMAGVVGGYLWLVHRSHRLLVSKELLVSVLFGSGVLLPALISTSVSWVSALLAFLLFSSICFWNCLAITRWEAAFPLPRSTAWLTAGVRATLLAAILIGLLMPSLSAPAAAAALASLGLAALDDKRDQWHGETLGTCADAALLLPVLIVWLAAAVA